MQYAEGVNNNLYKKMPKPMLQKLGSSVRQHREVRERERRKRKQRHWRYRNTDQTRSGGGDKRSNIK